MRGYPLRTQVDRGLAPKGISFASPHVTLSAFAARCVASPVVEDDDLGDSPAPQCFTNATAHAATNCFAFRATAIVGKNASVEAEFEYGHCIHLRNFTHPYIHLSF